LTSSSRLQKEKRDRHRDQLKYKGDADPQDVSDRDHRDIARKGLGNQNQDTWLGETVSRRWGDDLLAYTLQEESTMMLRMRAIMKREFDKVRPVSLPTLMLDKTYALQDVLANSDA
jgi:hypothetical protein